MAARNKDGVGNSALLKLIGLTDVEEHRRRLGAQRFCFGRFDLSDLALGLREEVSEGGHGLPLVLGGSSESRAREQNPTD